MGATRSCIKMFASQSLSALVVVILCSQCHLCLNKQDIDPNSSILAATHLQNGPSPFHKHKLDTVEKSDHNFYLPIGKSNRSTRLKTKDNDASTLHLAHSTKPTKKPPTCSSYLLTFTTTPRRQCSYVKPLFDKSPSTKTLPKLNATDNCERTDIFIKPNDTKIECTVPEQDKPIPTSQQNATNASIPSEISPQSSIDSILIKPNEDAKNMPTFEEWRKKISETDAPFVSKQQPDLIPLDHPLVENTVQQTSPTVKLDTNRARNFASHECGAKIVDSNSEADFVNRVLNEQTDEYMLNPCKTKNWFVIELCETIQPQYLEMANFELYSSIPKEFTVYASEHYPARNEWSVLGAFNSNDVRTVQGFKLQKNGFVKYLKVELHSYYGSEHFCPISVIRAFGTSLFDEVERIDKPEPIDYINRDENSVFEESMQQSLPGQDIFGSAKKAVYSIFIKALNFNIFNRILDNFSLNKDSGPTFNVRDQSQVIKLYSNFEMYLAQCESFFINDNKSTMNIPSKCIFLQFSFPNHLFDMLYTQYFIRKYINKSLLFQCGFNATYQDLNTTGLTLLLTNSMQAFHSQLNHRNANKLSSHSNLSDKLAENHSHMHILDHINTSLTSSIVPSLPHKVPPLNLTLDPSLIQPTLVVPTVINTQHTLPLQSTMSSLEGSQPFAPQKNNTPIIVHLETKTEQVQLPPIAPDYEGEPLSSASGQSKEAVIIRLTSRIKNLEKNISLMSTYLENLSVRYRIQMEEMQLIFNRTIDHLNNTAIRAAEKDAKQQEFIMALESEINILKAKIASTLDAKDENWIFIRIHISLMIFELVLAICLCLAFYFIFRRISSSLLKTINKQSNNNQDLNGQLRIEEKQLIAQCAENKKSLYRSKSLSNLQEEPFTNQSPIESLPQEVPIDDTDCDNSDKENCVQILNPERYNNYNNSSNVQSNLVGDLTIDSSAKKILKAVNN